jgi:pectinesterase
MNSTKYKGLNFFIFLITCTVGCILLTLTASASVKDIIRFPVNKARKVNIDTHLELTFKTAPVLGSSGQIRIYDAKDNHLVDLLDISIPAGPTTGDTTKGADYTPVPYDYSQGYFTNATTKPGTPSGLALPTSDKYQLTIIGGFTDGFHFYPVIIHGNKATIYLHNNLLEYNKSYYVQIDPGVLNLSDGSFKGFKGKEWRFTTKAKPPRADSDRIIVSAKGSGDFNTVQGAIDFIPANNPHRITVFIKNGTYEEIVYFRNKSNITIMGESRTGVVVQYANNEVFNPHPVNIKTNEMPGTFPSRRAAFAIDHCKGIHLVNLTVKTTAKGQAEGLLINGEEIIVSHVTIVGSGDALQTNGTAYFTLCTIIGDGDTVLGRGAAFFINCELYSNGTFMWIRNTEANHGNVFIHSNFITLGGGETELARLPVNHGKFYPYAEAVLINCSLSGISPVGWGPIDGETTHLHFWEYNSTQLNSAKPVNVSLRHPGSRQLIKGKDSEILSNYSSPAFVLGGWAPDEKLLEQYGTIKK